MYTNKRREHIHIIKQYNLDTNKYTGKRVILFYRINGKINKDIYDLDKFYQHTYENPKTKKNSKSKWKIIDEINKNIIVKEMINYSSDKKYIMYHYLYESEKESFSKLKEKVFKYEKLNLPIL